MDEDKTEAEVEGKVTRESDDELSDEELSNVTGGEISIPYGPLQVTYTPSKP
jgi:bacteriocin-like protein